MTQGQPTACQINAWSHHRSWSNHRKPRDLPEVQTARLSCAGMIAGGSGLTPMMQVASQILSNSDDKAQV